MAASLYSGHVCIWNFETSSLVNSFEATELPVRTVKFIPRKQWLVCGADDMTIRVYNYNTMEKVAQFEAHQDYIRHVAVHPTLPLIISCSDDMTIKMWDWDKDWMCTQMFEGHGHYVMHVAFNPKDTNTFASASLDRTVKVWSLGSPVPNFTLEGHERGVNCVDYYVRVGLLVLDRWISVSLDRLDTLIISLGFYARRSFARLGGTSRIL